MGKEVWGGEGSEERDEEGGRGDTIYSTYNTSIRQYSTPIATGLSWGEVLSDHTH